MISWIVSSGDLALQLGVKVSCRWLVNKTVDDDFQWQIAIKIF